MLIDIPQDLTNETMSCNLRPASNELYFYSAEIRLL